ncbi:redox-regulated ATPase YchF [Candidatus Uhrbacteria bacterium CG10_big_fil_rev_8_21_14_0_10_48_11]|uniref:Ribosome-binding ATPase YchF n=1 Tax=Candidatus Uhrbacteria bacterium CG10_big_fil_rev_8_21_14_0_10_48_11 TaxID=1975037 RepID=A0A2M8LDV7_9BACT|nr:MAG: redox-regulated ATPase YchF [Candidatus Uhrbacteria bacterium CG10_big_fil_rev_8_21_14_0_10_48_11]
MSLKVGIVGLPNVGKSTLFKALTKKQVTIENYPFATIEPNVGVVSVPDNRLTALAATAKSAKIIPTVIEFVDIAGLVAGAHQGEGLGNKFLSHIREVDAIVEVVRDFTDSNITHVMGNPDPERDLSVIGIELAMADLDTVTRRIATTEGKARSGDKQAMQELALLTRLREALDTKEAARSVTTTDEEKKILRQLNLLTAKPLLVVKNVAEEDVKKNAGKTDELTISAKIESELAELELDDMRQYLTELGWERSGLDRLIQASYELLELITFFTAGPTETRAWTVRRGATAPQAAGVIHTDFEEGFVAAEIIAWQDLVAAGSEAKAKEQGLLRLEGKTYTVQDGDVAHFRFAPTS